MGWKYKTEAERVAAMKAYQAAYRALRKSGKWERKTNIHSPRIAAKYAQAGQPVVQPVEQQPVKASKPPKPLKPGRKFLTPEESKAREAARQHKYWHDHYSAIIKARRLAAMTPEQRAQRERRLAITESRTIQGVIREIVTLLAIECGVTPDEMMEKILVAGGVDFLMRAIEPRMTKRNYNRDVLIRTALEGARFFLNRDGAVLGWKRQRNGPRPVLV